MNLKLILPKRFMFSLLAIPSVIYSTYFREELFLFAMVGFMLYDALQNAGSLNDIKQDERTPLISESNDTTSSLPAYQTIAASSDALSKYCGPTSMTFCVHGNVFGVAVCCNDLGEVVKGQDEENGMERYQSGSKNQQVPSTNLTGFSRNDSKYCNADRGNYVIDKKARRKLIIASILCSLFMVVEIVGGVLSNSLAIATDAAHLLVDLASFMISLFSMWVASRPPTQRMSFGWQRAEVVGATVSVLLIWVLTGILVYEAIGRIYSGDYELDATIMLITSGVGIVVNIIMGASLHQHGHSHGGNKGDAVQANVEKRETKDQIQHGHAHDAQGKEKQNINVTAAFIHVLGDFAQSIGVFVAALIIFFQPEWKIVDPICTFIFSILVLATTITILRNTMNVLMEGIPYDVKFEVVKETFMAVPGILTLHNLRIWSLTTDRAALSVHLVIDPSTNMQEILKEASRRIQTKYGIFEMTLQIEEFQQDMDDSTPRK